LITLRKAKSGAKNREVKFIQKDSFFTNKKQTKTEEFKANKIALLTSG